MQISSYLQHELCYKGEVIDIKEQETSTAIIVKIDSINSYPSTSKDFSNCQGFKCLISVPATSLNIVPYDYIQFHTTLSSPQNQNTPDAFDYVSYLHRKGIVATSVVRPEDISVIGHRHSIFEAIEKQKYVYTHILYNSNLSEDTARFLNATIIGDASSISEEQRLTYGTAGIAHILALSGLHVGIISIVISLFLFPLYFMRKHVMRLIITIGLLWLYAISTGLSPSVTRAVIMASVYFGAFIFQRHHSSLNAVCFAALIILIADPMQLFDVGFQLSFIAVTFILLFANRLNPINRRRSPKLYAITSFFTVSTAAMLGTGIIAAYYFHRIPVYFLLGNVLASILLPPLIGGGVLLILLQSLSIPTDWLCQFIDIMYIGLDFVTTQINSFPGASIDYIYFPAWIILPYFCAIVALFLALFKRKAIYFVFALILLANTIILSYIFKPSYSDDEFFIPQDTYYTNIIYRHHKSAYLITTAPEHDAEAIRTLCQRRHRDFLWRRSCSDLQLIAQTDTIYDLIRYGNILTIGRTGIIIIKSQNDIPDSLNRPVDYALICRGFRASISHITNRISVDSILLSNDLHPRRHNRYIDECTRSGIPYRSLKEPKAFHIIQP